MLSSERISADPLSLCFALHYPSVLPSFVLFFPTIPFIFSIVCPFYTAFLHRGLYFVLGVPYNWTQQMLAHEIENLTLQTTYTTFCMLN